MSHVAAEVVDLSEQERGLEDSDAQGRTDLAVSRTRLALERTLSAWVRTALAMISFGFTIYRFLQEFEGEQAEELRTPEAARNIGIALVALGTLGLAAAVYQHLDGYKQLGIHPLRRPISVSLIVSMLIILLGMLVFLGIVAGLGPF